MDYILQGYRAYLIVFGAGWIVFLISILLDHVAPGCNLRLQFPDRVYDLLYLYPWQEELYSNLFLMGTLVFPFFFLYGRMKEVARLVFGIRGETAEIGKRKALLARKMGLAVLGAFVICLVLFLENAVFFLIEGNGLHPGLAWGFFFRLFWISLIYMVIAMFAAACADELETCEDMNMILLLLPYVLARMHSLIRFFSDQIAASNRVLKEPELVETWIRRLGSLQVLAPVTWCSPGIQYPVWYGVCAALLAVILGVAGISIFLDAQKTGNDA